MPIWRITFKICKIKVKNDDSLPRIAPNAKPADNDGIEPVQKKKTNFQFYQLILSQHSTA